MPQTSGTYLPGSRQPNGVPVPAEGLAVTAPRARLPLRLVAVILIEGDPRSPINGCVTFDSSSSHP